jgi:hypothetical protein
MCFVLVRFSNKIPVTFMTGFYVANVVSRYWEQFISLPMPDKLAYKLVAYIPGQVSPFSFIELKYYETLLPQEHPLPYPGFSGTGVASEVAE